MPTLEFKGKQFVYSHHLGVPFRELQIVSDKSLPLYYKKYQNHSVMKIPFLKLFLF